MPREEPSEDDVGPGLVEVVRPGAARLELAALRKTAKAPDPAACAAQAELIAKSPYN